MSSFSRRVRASLRASRVKTVGGGLLGRTSLGVLAAGARDDLLDPRNLCGPIAVIKVLATIAAELLIYRSKCL